MNDLHRWNTAITRLADESNRAAPPAHLESTLLREFDRTHRHGRARTFLATITAAAAASAILWFVRPQPTATLQVSLAQPAAPWSALSEPQTAPAPVHSAPTTQPVQTELVKNEDRPFIPIPYVAPLDPYERAEVVRMDLPVSALIAAGMQIDADDAGASVQADVLVGQDGRPRAVRLVSISNFNE
ncbi:MAG TPA: hypothetical protein VGN17_23270 [Bryobacteraceae bacterium]